MYNGNNPSALRSQECIANACVLQMQHHALSKLTVKDIMVESGLARQTFYQVFDSKDEIIDYHLDKLFTSYMEKHDISSITNLCDTAKLFFSFFDENKKFIVLVIQNEMSNLINNRCKKYLFENKYFCYEQEGVESESQKKFAISFIVAGIVGILVDWVHEGCITPADDMADLVCRITNTHI